MWAVELKAMTIRVVDGKVVLTPGFERRRFFNWHTSFFEPLVECIGIWRVEFDVRRSIFQQAQAPVANGEQGEGARPMYQDLHSWNLCCKTPMSARRRQRVTSFLPAKWSVCWCGVDRWLAWSRYPFSSFTSLE